MSKRVLTIEGWRSNIRHVRDTEASSTEEVTGNGERKNLKKVWKKVLTNEESCDILTKLSRKKETAKHLENYIVHQQTSQVNSDRKIENNGRERNMTKRNKSEQNAERRLEIELKSLILAQDERWRRA